MVHPPRTSSIPTYWNYKSCGTLGNLSYRGIKRQVSVKNGRPECALGLKTASGDDVRF